MTQSVTACLIIIGNEILSGRTQDTNLKHLALSLNELGVKLVHVRVIPDEERIIVETVNECRVSFDNVFTTGGIGPTHDDITADCIGLAFQKRLIINQEIKEIIERREAPPEVMETRMRMARIPEGATLIENPTGGPHGFQVENVFVLAGVPTVMQAMLSNKTKHKKDTTSLPKKKNRKHQKKCEKMKNTKHRRKRRPVTMPAGPTAASASSNRRRRRTRASAPAAARTEGLRPGRRC